MLAMSGGLSAKPSAGGKKVVDPESNLFGQLIGVCTSLPSYKALIVEITPKIINLIENDDSYITEGTKKAFINLLIGHEMDKLLGKQSSSTGVLIEPYFQSYNTVSLASRFSSDIMEIIDQILKNREKHAELDEILTQLRQNIVNVYVHCVKNGNIFEENAVERIDIALLSSIRNTTFNPNEYLLKLGLNQVQLAEPVGHLNEYSVQSVDAISGKLLGKILPPKLRSALWEVRFLYGYEHLPLFGQTVTDTYASSLHKGKQKHSDSRHHSLMDAREDLDMDELTFNLPTVITDAVSRGIANGFEIQSTLVSHKLEKYAHLEKELAVLSKRVSLLVQAGYVYTGSVSDRMVLIALLLMWIYPKEPPTSEKMVQILSRILMEYLPSDNFRREYNVAATAFKSWHLLQLNDPKLCDHLEKVFYAMNSNQNTPVAVHYLKGWLDTGFLGWVSEYVALYLWDQLVLIGGKPNSFRDHLPYICYKLLCLLRDDILATSADIIDVIKLKGKRLPLDLVAKEIILVMPEDAVQAAVPEVKETPVQPPVVLAEDLVEPAPVPAEIDPYALPFE